MLKGVSNGLYESADLDREEFDLRLQLTDRCYNHDDIDVVYIENVLNRLKELKYKKFGLFFMAFLPIQTHKDECECADCSYFREDMTWAFGKIVEHKDGVELVKFGPGSIGILNDQRLNDFMSKCCNM